VSRRPAAVPLPALGFSEAISVLAESASRRERLPPSLADAIRSTRRGWWEGEPDGGPLVATGHQASLWHPGILAKFLIAERLAARLSGRSLHLLVDQDQNHLAPLEYPAIAGDLALTLARLPLDEPDPAAPIARRRCVRVGADGPQDAALPEIGEGLAAIAAALRRCADAESAAEQCRRAIASLAGRWLKEMPLVRATTLLATPIGLWILDAIADSPQRCQEAFNLAIRDRPGAARPLRRGGDRVEAPLWRLGGIGEARQPLFLSINDPPKRRRELLREAAIAAPSRLAPRGLLATGALRLAADLFIHGRGGWAYDRATERWFREWLGAELPPMAMASADLRLPLADAIAAPQSLRSAWHDPFPGSESGRSERKRRWLAEIDALPRRSEARRRAYRAMQEAISNRRRERGLAPPPRRPDAAAIAARRDWPFPLHPTASIDRLADAADRFVAALPRPPVRVSP
jgi:hypothetical protein